MTAALQTLGLVRRFGGILATDHVSLCLERGARYALIGPNGAGKTTFVNLLSGVLAPSEGRILLEGADISHLRADRRARLGLARTFQINQLFAALTPAEALAFAVTERMGRGATWWRRAGAGAVAAEVAEIAERFQLADMLGRRTSSLPYGKQRLLEIALAFAARPRVLLLDEPAAGVPEAEREDIVAAIAALPRDVCVLLVEHDMDLVFAYADRISVLADGALLMEGPPEAVARDERVRAVYLGEGHDG